MYESRRESANQRDHTFPLQSTRSHYRHSPLIFRVLEVHWRTMPRQGSRKSLHRVQFYNDPRLGDNLPASTDPKRRRLGEYKVNAGISLPNY